MTTLFSSTTYCDIFLEQAIRAQQLCDVVNAFALHVALLLPLGLQPFSFVVRERRIKIDLGEFADQIREHERVRIVGIHVAPTLLREIGFVAIFRRW